MKKFFAEFKAFAMRGNVLDMAVGVVIGGAFGKITTSLVNDILMPLLSLLTGGVDFSSWKWVLKAASVAEDGTEIAEVSAFQVKVSKNFDTINICGQMAEDRKLTGVKITGSMTLHKVYSRGADDVEQAMSGHDLRKTLVGKLDDPDAYGAERVAVYGVSYDEQVLMDWEAGKAGSMTISFQATNVEYLDKVEA